MAKSTSVKVRLESEAGTGYRYYAKRSTRAEYKLKMKKFDPWALNSYLVRWLALLVFRLITACNGNRGRV